MLDIDKFSTDLPVREVEAGEVLLKQGDTTGKVYVLKEGTLEVLRDGERITSVDEPGAPFGEISMLLDTPHQATVQAETAATLIEIDDFEALVRNEPQIVLELTETLARRLTATNEILAEARQEFENLLEAHGGESEEAKDVKNKIRAAWERFGEVMRTEIADF